MYIQAHHILIGRNVQVYTSKYNTHLQMPPLKPSDQVSNTYSFINVDLLQHESTDKIDKQKQLEAHWLSEQMAGRVSFHSWNDSLQLRT